MKGMFEHLDDPAPPSGDETRRAAVGERASLLRQRQTALRRTTAGLAALAALAGVMAVVAVDDDPAQQVAVEAPVSTTPPTSATVPPSTTPTTASIPEVPAVDEVIETTTTTAAPAPLSPACNSRSLRSGPPPGMEVTLVADRTVYQVGETIELTLTARNTTDQPQRFYVHPSYVDRRYLEVEAADGTLLYSDYHGPNAMLREPVFYDFSPGEQRAYHFSFVPSVCIRDWRGEDVAEPATYPSGRYVFWGEWLSGWTSNPVEIDIR